MRGLPVCVVALSCLLGCVAAACETEGDGFIQGSPLSFWLDELRAPDRDRQRAAGETLREHAGATLTAVVFEKARQGGRGHRNLHQGLRGKFQDAAEAVPSLLTFLDCENERAREAAVQVLGWIGPEARKAIPALITALDDPDPGVRMQTGFTLGHIGVADAKVLSALAATLADEDWYPANAAATALAGVWPGSKQTLRAALTGDDARVRYFAMRGIRRIRDLDSDFLPILVERAEQDTEWNRNEALLLLYRLDPGQVAPYYERLSALLDVDAVRCEAGRLLAGRLGPETESALISMLIDLMQGPQSQRGDQCHEQVHTDLPRFGEAAVDPLGSLLDHPDLHVRRSALIGLMSIEPRPDSVFPYALLAMEDADLRPIAAGRLVDSGVAAVASLREALRHEDPGVRAGACRAASRIGEPAQPLVPLLVERLALETGETRKEMILALGRIGGDAARAATPALRAALDEPELHAAAASALARISGADAADLTRDLIAALAEQSQGICPHPTADDDLRRIGPAAAPAIVEALGDPDYGPRLALLRILSEWGEEGLRPATAVLREWVDRDGGRALAAAEGLVEIDELEPERAAAIFREAMGSASDSTRLRGSEGLAKLGGDACRSARETLEELSGHENESFRNRAQAALVLCPGEILSDR